MENIILQIINQYGYIGITFLIALENLIPPIPSEIILSLSGFISSKAHLNVFFILLAATLGSLIGAIILYYIAYFIGLKILDSKILQICGIKKEKIKQATNHFKANGKSSIFFGRFIPIIRSFISIPAGLSKMNFKLFMILTTLGSLIWNTLFIFIGFIFKDKWETITSFIKNNSLIICLIAIIFYLIIKKINSKKIITVK